MVTIQSQNFGVEIEMTGVSRGTAASVIANYFGVGGIHFAGGTYQTYEAKDSKGRVWKCMRDGSITPRRRIGGAIVEADDAYRCEVVTPILQYEDITDLQEVIRALVKKGAMANSSCGIHVHVDGANHTPESLCRLLNFATGRQDLFYEALQIGNRADHWCHKINPALFREMKKNGRASRNDAERIWYSVVNDGYDGGVDSSHYNSTRYHGINYVQFCLAMSAWAINCDHDNLHFKSVAGYTQQQKHDLMLRVLTKRLGMRGPEFKTARLHLTSAFLTEAESENTAA